MFKKVIFAGGILLSSSMNLVAAEVTNTFSSGGAIVAAEMNQNFTDLITVINTLETKVAALEAASGNPTTSLQEKIAGSTYKVSWVNNGYFGKNESGGFADYVRFGMGGGSSVMVFNADGSLTDTGSDLWAEGSTTTICKTFDQDGACTSNDNMLEAENDSWTGDVGSWTLNSATNILTLTFPGEDSDYLQVSEDGSTMSLVELGDSTEFSDNAGHTQRQIEAIIAVGIRIPSQP